MFQPISFSNVTHSNNKILSLVHEDSNHLMLQNVLKSSPKGFLAMVWVLFKSLQVCFESESKFLPVISQKVTDFGNIFLQIKYCLSKIW